MELFLNLAWLLVAGVIVCLWLRVGSQRYTGRRRQLMAIAVLIAILFPVISMSDDLLAMQSAVEADSYRRDHMVSANGCPVQPMLAVIVPLRFLGLGIGFLRFIAPNLLPIPKLSRPEIVVIENRPPPAA
jgi:hypothetical protein